MRGRMGRKGGRVVLKHKRITVTARGAKRMRGEKRRKAPRKRKKPEERLMSYRKAPGRITTEIDDMLRTVSERKKVKADRLARSMKVSEERIMEWAGVLEERGLVRVHYPAIGRPEIRAGTGKGK